MASALLNDQVCAICHENFESTSSEKGVQVHVSARGLPTLIEFSQLNSDTDLTHYLRTNADSVFVHKVCRKLYTNKRKFDQMTK